MHQLFWILKQTVFSSGFFSLSFEVLVLLGFFSSTFSFEVELDEGFLTSVFLESSTFLSLDVEEGTAAFWSHGSGKFGK